MVKAWGVGRKAWRFLGIAAYSWGYGALLVSPLIGVIKVSEKILTSVPTICHAF